MCEEIEWKYSYDLVEYQSKINKWMKRNPRKLLLKPNN